MTKKIKILSREEKIDKIREGLHEVETTTRVRAWVFKVEKQYYVIISWYMPLGGDRLSIFPSTGKGAKKSEKHLLEIKNSKDHTIAFEEAMKLLVPETEPFEMESTKN